MSSEGAALFSVIDSAILAPEEAMGKNIKVGDSEAIYTGLGNSTIVL